jgi:hypothetical protein
VLSTIDSAAMGISGGLLASGDARPE